jgi:hypothetical protein
MASRLPHLAHGLVALLALAAVWGVDYLPTHDGPQHIFGVHASQRLGDPEVGYGRFLEPNLPITSHGFALVFAPFDRWLPWRTATRLALSCLVLVWCAGAFFLARAVQPGRAWIGVALAAAAFQWSLYMGLFSYYLASAFGLWVLAAALAPQPWTRARSVALSGLLLAQALMHVVPAVVTGVLVLPLALLRARPGERRRALYRVALLGIPAACVALALVVAGFENLARDANGEARVWSPARTPLWAIAGCFTGGPGWRSWFLPLIALSAPLALWRLRCADTVRSADVALLVGGGALLAFGVAAPLHLPAWDYFSVRFLPAAICCLVLVWPIERLRTRARRGLAAALLVSWAFASSGWAVAYNRALATRAADALAGLEADLLRDGPRLPIVLDPYLGRSLDERSAPMPYAVPLANLGQLYATAQGGYAPHSFALSWQIHPVLLRAEARRAFPPTVDRSYGRDLAKPALTGHRGLREALLTYLGALGTHYQDVILWGRPEDGDRLLQLGYEPDFRRGGLLLAHFRGCPLTLTFPPASLPPPGTRVELGWLPAWHVTHRYDVDKSLRDSDGRRVMPLATPPCGGVWFRLTAPDAEAIECEGADAQGRLAIASTLATPQVECRVRPRSSHTARADAELADSREGG